MVQAEREAIAMRKAYEQLKSDNVKLAETAAVQVGLFVTWYVNGLVWICPTRGYLKSDVQFCD